MLIHSGEQSPWFHEYAPLLGLANILGESISKTAKRNPKLIPDLRTFPTLLLGSDYAGFHRGARFEVISLIISNPQQLGIWNQRRELIRQTVLPDGRRMSYKNLNDRNKQKALSFFLDAANQIPGLLLTVAIDRRIDSIF